MATLTFEHIVHYSNNDPLSVDAVVDSLRAMERIATSYLPKALSCLTNTEIQSVEVLVEGLEEGSFIEKLLLRVLFKDDAEAELFADRVRESIREGYARLPGGGYPVIKALVVSGVVGGLVVVGADLAINAMNQEPQAQPLVNLNNSNVVVIGAEAYKVSPEDFIETLRSVADTVSRKKLAQSALDVIAPAKAEPGAKVSFSEDDTLALGNDLIAAAPTSFDPEAHEREAVYSDVDLEIRATDRDKRTSGWAGVIPRLIDRRVKLVFADGVDVDALAGKFKVRADVTVKSRMNSRTGKMDPVLIRVDAVIPQDE